LGRSKILVLSIAAILLAVFTVHSFNPPAVAVVNSREETRGTISLIYPEMEGTSPQANNINYTIQQAITKFTDEQNKPDRSGQVGYKIEFNKNHVLSVKLKESFYAHRAAHPMSFQRSLTFNTKTGEVLELADLFLPDADYKARLNQLAIEQITQRKVFLLKPYNGLTPDQEFYLTDDSLVLYYQLYEYTAYVYGFLEIAIPYDQLAGFIRPEILD
jgi:hypothetical protein